MAKVSPKSIREWNTGVASTIFPVQLHTLVPVFYYKTMLIIVISSFMVSILTFSEPSGSLFPRTNFGNVKERVNIKGLKSIISVIAKLRNTRLKITWTS